MADAIVETGSQPKIRFNEQGLVPVIVRDADTAVIEDAEVIYRILAQLNLLAPGDRSRAPPPSGLSGFALTHGSSPCTSTSELLHSCSRRKRPRMRIRGRFVFLT